MTPEVWAAIIIAITSLITSFVAIYFGKQGRAQQKADAEKLNAETEKLRVETDALRINSLKTQQKNYRDLLTNFINPFHTLLDQNQRIYSALLGDRGALEYHPIVLRRYFNSLPNEDRRKLYWYQRIERLRENNRQIIGLIQQYSGSIVTGDLRNACADFWFHVFEWEDVWKAVENTLILSDEEEMTIGDPIPGNMIVEKDEPLYANRFPASLWAAISVEEKELSKMAGQAPVMDGIG